MHRGKKKGGENGYFFRDGEQRNKVMLGGRERERERERETERERERERQRETERDRERESGHREAEML